MSRRRWLQTCIYTGNSSKYNKFHCVISIKIVEWPRATCRILTNPSLFTSRCKKVYKVVLTLFTYKRFPVQKVGYCCNKEPGNIAFEQRVYYSTSAPVSHEIFQKSSWRYIRLRSECMDIVCIVSCCVLGERARCDACTCASVSMGSNGAITSSSQSRCPRVPRSDVRTIAACAFYCYSGEFGRYREALAKYLFSTGGGTDRWVGATSSQITLTPLLPLLTEQRGVLSSPIALTPLFLPYWTARYAHKFPLISLIIFCFSSLSLQELPHPTPSPHPSPHISLLHVSHPNPCSAVSVR